MHQHVTPRNPMRMAAQSILLSIALGLAAAPSHAQLQTYSQSFEGMTQSDLGALSSDGWLVYGNVFTPALVYLYGYGPFPAPNGGAPAFSILETGQGGVSQGNLQLSVFSDYQNADHANGNLIESNVFQERTIAPTDVGTTWYFEFDAKLGNLVSPSTAIAFIKTLQPPTYALTNFLQRDMSAIATTWNRYSVSIPIVPALSGQILQFGFASTTTNYIASGVFYDNIEFSRTSTVGVTPRADAGTGLRLSVHGNPGLAGSEQTLSFAVPSAGRVSVRVFDVHGALVTSVLDRELDAGMHRVSWRGADAAGRRVASGIYIAEVIAGSQRATTKLSRLQ